jgi:SAM-dependent methyltransferase
LSREEIRMNYALAYRVGFHPWEDAQDQPAFKEGISALFDEEESGREPPYGLALDLGTGSGIWGVELAKRGWQVTGIDLVEKALERARARATDAGIEMRLVHGSVTDLQASGIEAGCRLIIDTGTFHGLGPDERRLMGREVDAVAAVDATVLVLAWQPRQRGPLPKGVGERDIQAAFPGWEVADLGSTRFQAPKPVQVLFNPGERWFRIRRRQGAA